MNTDPPAQAPEPIPPAASEVASPRTARAGALTRGPGDPQRQHAGPPIAMACRAIESVARDHGPIHTGRLTANLLRSLPIAEFEIEAVTDCSGRPRRFASGACPFQPPLPDTARDAPGANPVTPPRRH